MQNALILILLGLLPGFISCKREQVQEEPPVLLADYFVRYLQEEKELKAYASFKEADTLESARPKTFLGGVSFQGAEMAERELPDQTIRYNYTQAAAYPDSFRFLYHDDTGQPVEQLLRMDPIDHFFIDGELKKSQGARLVIEGAPLKEEESLILLFNDQKNQATLVNIEGPSADTIFFLSPEQLVSLRPGKSQLYLVKKQRRVNDTSRKSIVTEIEFYTRTIDVEVME